MVPGKLNLAEVTVMDEDQARKYIEAVVWPNGPVCPHCGGTKAWDIKEGTASVNTGTKRDTGFPGI